jgi:[acyl-carrier-protein] S-malonyltransferase
MKKVALMFSGQGAQYHGTGFNLYDTYDSVKDVFLQSETVTNYPIRDISFNDGDDRLNQTKYTQVCMFTLYQAILVLLEEKGIHINNSMGLSLGEYGAYLHQGVFDFSTGLKLIRKRASLMENATMYQPGSMSAVIGMKADQLSDLIDDVDGYVSISNYNSYQQLVISGESKAVKQLGDIAKANGAKRIIPLNTSGAFHSALMKTASQGLMEYLNDIDLNEPKMNLYLNTTGQLYDGHLRQHMARQLTHSVRFYQMVETMIKDGVDTFVEIGPKKTLCQLVRRIDGSVKVLNIEDNDSLLKTLQYLEENNDEL